MSDHPNVIFQADDRNGREFWVERDMPTSDGTPRLYFRSGGGVGASLERHRVAQLALALEGWLEENPSPHTYVVGLPVILTVHPDGAIEYDVDFGDAASAIRELEPSLEPGDVTEEELEEDACRVENASVAWFKPAKQD